MPVELAGGVLGDKKYRDEHAVLKTDEVQVALEKHRGFRSQREWLDFVRILMKQDRPVDRGELVYRSGSAETFREIQLMGGAGFDEIWKGKGHALEEYLRRFESLWLPAGDRVLSNLSRLAKTDWRAGELRVHFVDCLYGGFGWMDCIGVAPVQDLDIEMKLVAHEFSELTTPQGIVAVQAERAGLNPGIAHTVVDMLAYFSVRDSLTEAGRAKKGVRPNPNYYPAVKELFPFFERYAENPTIYPSFGRLMEDMISTLKTIEPPNGPTGPSPK